MKKQLTAWLLALVMLFSLVGCGADAPVQDDSSLPQQEQQDAQNAPSEDADTLSDDDASAPQIDEDGAYTTKDDVALYIHTYGHLPDNFITKKDAQALGWPGGSLEPYAPGKCIGGSRFGNYEGLLPEADGRTYAECDIDTLGADSRGAKPSSQTTASFTTPKTTTRPLNCCTERSDGHALCIRSLRLRDR